MPEEVTQKDIREINYKMEDVEKSVGLLLKARRQEVIADLMENCFRKSVEKIRIFLAIDGESSINEIADKLEIKPPNVSRHIRDFLENDLIKLKNTEGNKIIYEKTSQVRRLRLEKHLLDNFKEELERASKKSDTCAEQDGSQARILSQVLDFFHRHNWQDTDDFSLRLVDKIANAISNGYMPYSVVLEATKTKTCFFLRNRVSRKLFCSAFIKELSSYLKEIGVATTGGSLSFSELFPEIKSVDSLGAEALLPKLELLEERKIQDALRSALREKGATNMVQRKSDSSLEVCDLEDFSLKIGGRDTSFTSVVKGYKSVKHTKIRLEDISHQVMKAFNGTFPDYILLVLAKPPVDGVITNLVRYGESVGNRHIIILVDSVELARFLCFYNVI